MPLINKDTLISFLGSESFATKETPASGFDLAVSQAENTVFQYTGIPVPASIDNAIPILQFCAHAIAVKIISFRQKLSDAENDKRQSLYDDAMKILKQIKAGELIITDNTGAQVVNIPSSGYYCSDEDRQVRL
jgi:hypothetical protein